MTIEARFSTGMRTQDSQNDMFFEKPLISTPPKNLPQYEFSNDAEYGPGVPLSGPKMYGSAYTVRDYAVNNVRYHDKGFNILSKQNPDGSFGTGNSDPNKNKLNTGLKASEKFAVSHFSPTSDSTLQTCKTNDFGYVADRWINCLALKIFNSKIVPGLILYGCTYLEVKEQIKINSILIIVKGNLIEQRFPTNPDNIEDRQSLSFSNYAVTSSSSGDTRDHSKYQKQLNNINGQDFEKQLSLPLNLNYNDDRLKPFSGPIILPPGTYAIPFAIRIPNELNITVNCLKSIKKDEPAYLENLGVLNAIVTLEALSKSSEQAAIATDQLPFFLHSGASLPKIVNGTYQPGYAEIFNVKYKNSKVLLILEKKNLKLEDKLIIYLYSNNKKAVNDVFVDVIVLNTMNITKEDSKIDIKGDVKRPLMKLVAKSNKYDFKNSVLKTFTSKVSELYPISSNDYDSITEFDDQIMLPESNRISGCIIELPIAPGCEPSYEKDKERIEYYLRVHLDVHGTSRTVVETVKLTLAEDLYYDYPS